MSGRRFGRMSAWTIAAVAVLGAALSLSGCGLGSKPADKDASTTRDQDTPGITEAQIEAKAKAMLATLGAPATPEQKVVFQGDFEAAGDEPGWRLVFTPDYVSFERPGLDTVSAAAVQRDFRAQGLFAVAGPLSIAIQSTACSYGTDNYPYTASVLFEGVVYDGCARTSAGVPKSNRGWAERVHQYLPAIDLCLSKVTAKPGRVTIAYVNEDGQNVVRVLENDGGREECVTSPDQTQVMSFEPLSDRSVFEGERDPLFTRSPTAAPKGYSSEQVLDLNGHAIGYLSRKSVAGAASEPAAPKSE